MRNTTLLATLVATTILGASSIAMAGGQANTLGIGAEYVMTGPIETGFGGFSASYDTGKFHVGGYVSMADADGPDNTDIGIGGRFYYHVASRTNSDFSIGGSLGYLHDEVGPDASNDLVELSPGIQIRAFIVDNVALSFDAGIAIGLGDADGFAVSGNLLAGAGLHYYFF